MSQNQTKKFAKRRGDRLREVLGVEDDSFIFEVEKVRNAFEHYDEHLDSRMALRTPDGDAPSAVAAKWPGRFARPRPGSGDGQVGAEALEGLGAEQAKAGRGDG
ncbi:hypothetical protein AB0C12_30395 [Actinoplanes sp. NPDC048967]|uniref:hypothetical protein n=1 Tax=Actinoplanes sp. NPDC048967 TaxID=3155269 RepID=UPI0033F683F4